MIYKYEIRVNLYWCRWAKDCKTPIKEHYKGDWNSTQHSNSVLSTFGKETCSLQEVLCPDAKFWEQSELSTMATTWDTKKDLIQAYLMLKRSEEELALLEKEKLNTLEYWSKAVPT